MIVSEIRVDAPGHGFWQEHGKDSTRQLPAS